MAIHWKIPFKSLRSNTIYTVNIYDKNFSGTAVELKGGIDTFTTDEEGSDDPFIPIRTQSGYFRIVDDGKDVNGQPFNWKQLLPSAASDRPVTLTDGNGTVCWAGFMQSQTFSGALYGNPQVREFPVTCALSILAGEDVDFNRGLKNFAFLLKEVCDIIDVQSGGHRNSQDLITTNGAVHIDYVYVQGGPDASSWLINKVDWQNFSGLDGEGVLRSKYSLFEVLEDMCRFWGWTARICGTTLYLTCADDATERDYLVLNRSQLNTKATQNRDTTSGSSYSPRTVSLVDSAANPIFVSTDQTDYKIQGPHRAVVKSDCNEHDTVVTFAPKDIEDKFLGEAYGWEQGDGDLVGYFTTPVISGSYNGKTLKINSNAAGGFCRRQIYQTKDTDTPTVGDMILITGFNGSVTLQTKLPMSFSGGSISFGGTAWMGTVPLEQQENLYTLRARLGIGMTYQDAKWWSMTPEIYSLTPSAQIQSGWGLTPSTFNIPLQGNNLKSTGVMLGIFSSGLSMSAYPSIPVEENTYGYIFVEIVGAHDYTNGNEIEAFEIANFEIKYSRDTIDIPTSTSVVRPREMKQSRVTSVEYSAVNSNTSKDEWNANCIFASDNNMKYGYGLILDPDGGIVSTVQYDYWSESPLQQHPEQHFANRVADFWESSKRRIDAELIGTSVQSINGGGTCQIGDILPCHYVTLDGSTFIPISISRNWRDDIVKLSLLQL